MIAAGVAYCCAGCGSPPIWRAQALRLVIDHISGDWLDNRLENLRFLCPKLPRPDIDMVPQAVDAL
jgi:hypothetical protein